MQFIGVLKRVLPFFMTFAAGLFIASFFVTLSAPKFDGVRKHRFEKSGKKHCRAENERLNREILRLERENQELRESAVTAPGVSSWSDIEMAVPPPPPAPVAPVRELKMKTVTVK